MRRFDLAVVNGTVVFPYVGAVACDIAVRGGKVAVVADTIDPAQADEFIDARGKLVFPGGVDSHYHLGIYRPMSEDARTETASSLVGGVTTILSYFRTGRHYLDKSGPYRAIFPEVLSLVRGRAYTDYGFHIAIMTEEQLEEVDWLVREQGVGSFKYYMFYKGLPLAGEFRASDYTMSDAYDLGHLFLLMRQVAEAAQKYAQYGRVSLSLHCEHAELIRVFMQEVKRQGIGGLEAYHRARPPLTERLSMAEAVLLAEHTGCPINLLHLSSREAVEAATRAKLQHPQLQVRLETTVHHLALTYATASGCGACGKVNPPIRAEGDREALWQAVLEGHIDTVVSDHACCHEAEKGEDIWKAVPGFGGTALLYPFLISEGYHVRGLSLTRIAELVSANPARAFGLYPKKGSLAVGSDADLVIVDPYKEQVVTPEVLHSAQDFTPFEGMRVRGWPVVTVLRGRVVFRDGQVLGEPAGQYLRRPCSLFGPD